VLFHESLARGKFCSVCFRIIIIFLIKGHVKDGSNVMKIYLFFASIYFQYNNDLYTKIQQRQNNNYRESGYTGTILNNDLQFCEFLNERTNIRLNILNLFLAF
jgi:hypothetical protein